MSPTVKISHSRREGTIKITLTMVPLGNSTLGYKGVHIMCEEDRPEGSRAIGITLSVAELDRLIAMTKV
jgi:hypothetical protein